MISAMERLAAALDGQPSNRIPVFSVLLDQGAKEMGMSLEDYYSRGEYVAEGRLRMRARYGYDNVWGLFHVAKEAELWGCKNILFSEDGPPNVGHMVIRSFDDIVKIQTPKDIFNNPAFMEQRKCLEILRSEVGGRHPICAYVTSSTTMPAILMGMEKWMELLFAGPPELRDMLLAKCSDYVQDHLAALRKAGADIIFYANPFASTDFLPLKLIEKLALPWMIRDLQGDSMDGLVFFCAMAHLNRSLHLAIEQVGFRIVYLSPLDDVATGKRIVAGRALTGAAFNDMVLLRLSEQQIREGVRNMLAAGIPGGRFLFGTVLMPWRIPERSIHTLFEAAYEFGAETFQ